MKNAVFVTFYFSDPGTFSKDVMNQCALEIQKFFFQKQAVKPENVLVRFSADHVPEEIFVPKSDTAPEGSVKKKRVLVDAGFDTDSWEHGTDFGLKLKKLFGHKGEISFITSLK